MASRSKSESSLSQSGAQLPIPEQIGRYVVLDRLATGGMAEVFICVERQLAGLERLVVVKRILPHLAVHDTFVEMFLAEARYVARIAHPNVVAIHELGEDDGLPFLSMEYVAGCSLRDLLVAAIEADAPLPIGVALGLAIQACAGAHSAHELQDDRGRSLGLVHRDISPHNLMVTGDGHVKLLDFGIAKATEVAGIDNTKTGALKGKVHYMAPEQCKQEPLDRRADVFALGIVAWELLASERLFKRSSELEAMQAIVNGDLRDLKKLRPDVPDAVIRAVEKALIPDKEARYQTAEAMKRALNDAAQQGVLDASSEAIAAFLKPIVGHKVDERHQSFMEAKQKPRPPRDLGMQRVKTGTYSRSFGGDADEGDSTVADKPNRNASAPTVDGKAPVTDKPFSPNTPADTGHTKDSLSSLPKMQTPKRRSYLLAASVALLTCALVTLALLWPRLTGPKVSGSPLVVAWPPTVAPEKLQEEVHTLERLLEEATGRPVHIEVVKSYDDVVVRLKNGSAGFGILPPYLFLVARKEVPGIVPLATKLVDGSASSDGVILVREDNDIQELKDLKGKTFCFPDKKSTTGWVLARAKLKEAGIDPDNDVRAVWSGNHTEVVHDVTTGKCDAGATYSGGYLAADRAGIPVGRLRTLAISGRSPQDMVVAAPQTPAIDRQVFNEALLQLDPKKSLGRDTIGVLERVSGFTVPRLADYDALEAAIQKSN